MEIVLKRWLRIGQKPHAVTLAPDGNLVGVVNDEGVIILDRTGHCRFRYPPAPMSWPARLLCATNEMKTLLVGSGQGVLLRLDLEEKNEQVSFQERSLYWTTNDLCSVAISADSSTLAIGHFSSAIAVLQMDGGSLWQHKSSHGIYESDWTVALNHDGTVLYAGTAGSPRNQLHKIDARTGMIENSIWVDGRITQIELLPKEGDVAIAVSDGHYNHRLLSYDGDLEMLMWEQSFDLQISALAAHQTDGLLLVASGFEGDLRVLETDEGEERGKSAEKLHARITALAYAPPVIAAATDDGNVALLHTI